MPMTLMPASLASCSGAIIAFGSVIGDHDRVRLLGDHRVDDRRLLGDVELGCALVREVDAELVGRRLARRRRRSSRTGCRSGRGRRRSAPSAPSRCRASPASPRIRGAAEADDASVPRAGVGGALASACCAEDRPPSSRRAVGCTAARCRGPRCAWCLRVDGGTVQWTGGRRRSGELRARRQRSRRRRLSWSR